MQNIPDQGQTLRFLAKEQLEYATICRERGNLAEAETHQHEAARYLTAADLCGTTRQFDPRQLVLEVCK